MDLAQWPQEIVVKPMEEIVPPITTTTTTTSGASNTTKPVSSSNCVERKIRPDQAVNCPRCNSTNTKFCYYNNYSLSQPRYFCKTCRRYWTEGGSLRNIPVGGGSRKNRRSSSSSSSCSSSSTTTVAAASNGLAVKKLLPADLLVPPVPIPLHHHHLQNPNKIQQDLNLGFSHHHSHQDFKTIAELIQVPNYESNNKESNNNSSNHPHHPSSSPASASQLSALELLTGMTSSSTRGLISSFIPMPIPDPNNNSVYSSFSLPEFKPSLNFSLDGIGNGGGGYFGNHHHHNHHHHLQGMQETTTSGGAVDGSGGRLFFPFEDLKSGSAPDNGAAEQDRDSQAGHGYWNGVLGAGGGSW